MAKCLLCFPAFTVLILAFATVNATAQMNPEAQECFDWFATLGYPEVKDASWVEASGISLHAQSPLLTGSVHGFLLKAEGSRFAIFTEHLTYEVYGGRKDALEHARYVTQTFPDYVKYILEEMKGRNRNPKEGKSLSGLGMSYSQVFFLAYECWRRGDAPMAQQLYDAIRTESVNSEPATPFREVLEQELGYQAIRNAELMLGGYRRAVIFMQKLEKLPPRKAVLEEFRRIVRQFPHCQTLEHAEKRVRILETMVEEDEHHRQISEQELAALPLEEKVRELIFRLRDCTQYLSIANAPEYGPIEARQLEDIGYAAVPQLIAAMSDERPNRTPGGEFAPAGTMPYQVYTVGDYASTIVAEISGQNFESSFNSADRAEDQKRALAWWTHFQNVGEKQALVEAVASGFEAPNRLIAKLEAHYPDAVEDALLQGASRAEKNYLRSNYLSCLGRFSSAKVTDFFLHELKESQESSLRVDAALQLWQRHHPAVLPAMLAEWQKPPARIGNNRIRDEQGYKTLIEILIASGDSQAMEALAAHWDQRPADEKAILIELLGQCLPPAGKWRSTIHREELDPKARDAALRLLAHALEDPQESGWIRVRGGKGGAFPYSDPHISDFALWALTEIDPEHFKFTLDPVPSRRQRERHCIEAANFWRGAHGQPLLEMPQLDSP